MSKSGNKQTALRRTAIHEAGHAVVAWAVGSRIHGATITPGEDHLGQVRHMPKVKDATLHGDVDRAQIRLGHQIKIAYAGALAVKRAYPHSRWRAGADNDFHNAAGDVLRVYEDAPRQIAWTRLLTLDTEALLERNWHAVEAVADVLVKRKTMSGAEVKAVIVAAFQVKLAALKTKRTYPTDCKRA